MVKKVLIVDDDTVMVQTLKEGLIRYDDTFMVLTAEDGLDAADRLKEHTVSIVVTDLKMPRMDGFSLLAHIMEHYPEIPVIIITGFSTSAMERAAWEGGAVGYISKPFMINDLAKKIITTLRREADGGTLHSISSGMFLQLVEMEEKTCTIRLVSKSTGRQGVLFFSQGGLLDARVDGLRGEEAAYEIFSWEEVSLSIQNSCQQKEKHIHRDLQAILLEAVRLKDERRSHMNVQAESGTKDGKEADNKKKALSPEGVKRVLATHLAEGAGVEDIYQDEAWKGLVLEVKRLAGFLKAGEFKAGYIDRGESLDFILLPGEKVTVVSVNPKCPRDRLMETLSELS
jgi:DNA-binding response OmpR family regulator